MLLYDVKWVVWIVCDVIWVVCLICWINVVCSIWLLCDVGLVCGLVVVFGCVCDDFVEQLFECLVFVVGQVCE